MEARSTTVRVSELLGRGAPGDAALIDGHRVVSHGELTALVDARRAAIDLPTRSLVAVQLRPHLESVVGYLALLAEGHVPLLAGDRLDRLVEAWRPMAILRGHDDDVELAPVRGGRHAELHPDLALLLSTSGATGDPKLVRLSHTAVVGNAEAIAESLSLSETDRAVTSLPLHYCYGLSVLHSHLVAGASVLLTRASVVDPCFAAAMARHRVTTFAGVPHTFELLDRAGPERIRTDGLRLLTQAGGRMAPEALGRWRRLAQTWGADLCVMYGQTEATARMTVASPEVARLHPAAVGRPIPGGEVRIHAPDADGVGEVVYRGPNVMLGYARSEADLAAGRDVEELWTGDRGRLHPDGALELTGRSGRRIKPFGLRLELDALEDDLRAAHPRITVSGDDDRLVAAAPGADPDRLHRDLVGTTGLPDGRVVVVDLDEVPRTESGKPDHAALLAIGSHPADSTGPPGSTGAGTVRSIYAALLGLDEVPDTTTFASAGGDSLSYVECALRLSSVLGALPEDWHLMTVADLEASAPRPTRVPRLDTTVALRAVGIAAVVATHMRLAYVPGGAHLLLAVVGFNLSRFHLDLADRGERVRAALRTVTRVAVPAMAVAAVGIVLSDSYGLTTIGLVNGYLGPRSHRQDHWHFWFIEVLAHLVVLSVALLAVPSVRRAERRWRYGFPMVLLVGAVALREVTWWGLDDPYNLRFRTHGVAWAFVLGWLVHRSTTVPTRLLTTAACAVATIGFFGRPQRELFIIAGLVLLTWVRQVPLPRALLTPVSTVAAASMWILISHFHVWPPLQRTLPLPLAYLLTIAIGVGVGKAVEHAPRAWRTVAARLRTRPVGRLDLAA